MDQDQSTPQPQTPEQPPAPPSAFQQPVVIQPTMGAQISPQPATAASPAQVSPNPNPMIADIQPPINPPSGVQTFQVDTPVPQSTNPTPLPGKQKFPGGKKKWFLAGGGLALFLLLCSGFVFGYYLPNQPDNVYKTGINRSGKALTALIDQATDKTLLESYKKSDINLKVDASYAGAKYNGTFDAKFDATKANAGLNFKSTGGEQDINFNAKLIGEVPTGSQFPNIYFQLNGLKSLGVEALYPALLPYDGKWIEVSSSYLKSLGNFPTADEANKKRLTSDDYAELAQAVTSVTTEYVFSSNPSKAVFKQKAFVGKETADGMRVYHYQVTANKDNATTYCKALVDKVLSTAAYKKLPWVDENNVDKDRTSAKKDCDDSKGDIKDTKVYDMWIDGKYKLIYKFRITDDDNKQNYTDIGQIYKGGDKISLFTNFHSESDKYDINAKLDSDVKARTTTGTLTYNNKESKDNVSITLETKPYDGEINTNKPAGAIPIQDVLKKFGIDPEAYVPSSASPKTENL